MKYAFEGAYRKHEGVHLLLYVVQGEVGVLGHLEEKVQEGQPPPLPPRHGLPLHHVHI